MCPSQAKLSPSHTGDTAPSSVDGRKVLQSTCNQVPTLQQRSPLKKIAPKTPSPPPPPPPPPRASEAKSLSAPTSPKIRSPRPPATKRLGSENTSLTSSSDRINVPKPVLTRSASTLERKKSKKLIGDEAGLLGSYNNNIDLSLPGSIAAVRREQMAIQNAQRKMKIAHYGRSKSAKFEPKYVPLLETLMGNDTKSNENSMKEKKRCSFITPNSDPLYVAYHDEEWGVPTHDDKMLFELLVLSGAQVGSDWTSILKKRQDFREAFSGFDAEIVANFTEKQLTTISAQYGIDLGRVRAVVDNANRILEIKKEFESFDKYIWGFINYKTISPQYKFGYKIPVKTSKSECISKDMVRRGFRTVGPTAVHSFMEAAGLTNDHLTTCYRHRQCTALTSARCS